MNMFRNLAVMALVVGFIACGDDSSTGSPTGAKDDGSSSSESVIPSSSSVIPSSSSVIPSVVEGSSSSDGSASSPTFSSSVEGSSSSVKVSSSSVKVPEPAEGSSSSVSGSGSSSSVQAVVGGTCKWGTTQVVEIDGVKKLLVCDDESIGWTIYVPKSSSSMQVSSSSHRYQGLGGASPLLYNGSYGEFTDPRDNQKYATVDISNTFGDDSLHLSFTVMAQNLKYHEKMVMAAEEQDDETKVEMYCYNDSIEYCNDWFGGLYQWAEAMALPYSCNIDRCEDKIDTDGDGFHQGICPDGWHIITARELIAASFNERQLMDDKALMSRISYLGGSGNNYSGLSIIATGKRKFMKDSTSKFDEFRRETYIAHVDIYELTEAIIERKGSGYRLTSNFGTYPKIGGFDLPKKDGVSVRCVKNY